MPKESIRDYVTKDDSSRDASPRCVVVQQQQDDQQKQQQSYSSPLPESPIVIQERYDRSMVHKAKLLVIQSKYREALIVGNEYLKEQIREGWKGPLRYFQTMITLHTPLILPLPSILDEGQRIGRSSSVISSSSSPSSSASMRRRIPTNCKEFFFQIRLGTQLTAVDEMATLVLQCWHELNKLELGDDVDGGSRRTTTNNNSSNNNNNDDKNRSDNNNTHYQGGRGRRMMMISKEAWRHLQPILDIYSLHPMPIQFFTEIWIRFWYHHTTTYSASMDNHGVSLSWGLQVGVFLVEYCARRDHANGSSSTGSSTTTTTPPLLHDLRDQLVEFIMTQSLPKLSSSTLAKDMAIAILTPTVLPWEPLIPQIQDDQDYHLEGQNQLATLRILQSVLQDQLTRKDTSSLLLVPKLLVEELLQDQCFQNIPPQEDRITTSSLLGFNARPVTIISGVSFPQSFIQGFKSILPTYIHAALDRFLQSATTALSEIVSMKTSNKLSDKRAIQQRRMQFAFSIVGILLAWRHRGWMRRCSKALSLAVLAPVIELVDALRTNKG